MIKNGTNTYKPICVKRQHESAFYGLAKAAGHDEKDSTLAVGEYTDEAKTAIQTMLDVPSTATVSTLSDAVSDLADDVSDLQTGLAGKVGDVQINGTSIVGDGVANIPIASANTFGVIKITADYGITIMPSGHLIINYANDARVKAGLTENTPIVPYNQHKSVFYGLAKIAGHDEKNSTLPVGQYSEEAKTAIRTMLGLQDVYEDYSSALTALGVIE